MTPSAGKCLINAVEIGELDIDLFRAEPIICARYAFSDAVSGTRFGMGNKNQGWSDATRAKLAEFLASLEADIVASLFTDAPAPSPTETVDLPTSDGVPGL